MPISNAPIGDRGDGKPVNTLWGTFYNAIRRALGGWSESLTGTVTLDMSNIPTNGTASDSTCVVNGARPGDVVICTANPVSDGLLVVAHCETPDTITISVTNVTSGLANPPETVYRVIVFRQ